jgi:hypothetical protein
MLCIYMHLAVLSKFYIMLILYIRNCRCCILWYVMYLYVPCGIVKVLHNAYTIYTHIRRISPCNEDT